MLRIPSSPVDHAKIACFNWEEPVFTKGRFVTASQYSNFLKSSKIMVLQLVIAVLRQSNMLAFHDQSFNSDRT